MAPKLEETKISLKLLVDTDKKKVVFAEADYSFVDIIFSFLTLPIATIIRLLRKDSDQKFEALGSLRNLYESVGNLPVKCFLSEESKLMLLNPGNPLKGLCDKLKLNIDDGEPTKYFTCKNPQYNCIFYSVFKGMACCKCGKLMTREINLRLTDGSSDNWIDDGVFVNDMTTFIISDDLHVIPNTTGSSIRLLKDLGLTNSSHLEERTVKIGLNEIRNLLKCAISCKFPLSCLFLPKTNVIRNLDSSQEDESDQSVTGKYTDVGSEKMCLKVTWQKSTGKLLFVETGEDFTVLLISFLMLPLGAVLSKLNGTTSVGSIDNIYTSLSNMCVKKCMKSKDVKEMLLKPHSVWQLRAYHNFYGCEKNFSSQDVVVQKVFVKGPAMFMVTDDLVITPFSSISSINFLNKLKVSLSDVEEHEVSIGMEEGLRILGASLTSSSALTNGLKLPLKKPKQEI